MRLDVTYKLAGQTLARPMGGYEVKIDGKAVTDIASIDLNLDAESIPEATIRYACYEGVTFSGDVEPHHVCPLDAHLPPDAPTLDELRRAVKPDLELPLSYEADTHEIEAYHTLRRLARAHLGLPAEETR